MPETPPDLPRTLGELRQQGFAVLPVKQEIRNNLIPPHSVS